MASVRSTPYERRVYEMAVYERHAYEMVIGPCEKYVYKRRTYERHAYGMDPQMASLLVYLMGVYLIMYTSQECVSRVSLIGMDLLQAYISYRRVFP
jgi:hypothetical protein